MNFAEFILGSIPLLIQLYAETYRETDFKNMQLELESEYNVPKVKTYDFIVVGGGSAGCVVAGRLSEQFNVLLLEMGGTPPPAANVPLYYAPIAGSPHINYVFQSVPQTNAYQCCGGIISNNNGMMLGGSGSHNGLVHSRGNPKDFDNWATLLNDESFNYTNVLKYFKKMETFLGPKLETEGDEYYGHDGPIIIESHIVPMLDLWLDAGRELGYLIGDPNGFQREGFQSLNMAIRNGKRSSSYVEYIKPYESSRNTLTVIRYANVSEILVDDEKRAYGVAYTRHGFPQIAHAQKEIIVSAGAVISPLLLMKSGIGPESILNAAEIPVKVALEAVGKNVKDHAAFGLFPFSVNDSSLFQKINTSDTENILEQYHNGKGILSLPREGAQCYITSSKAEPDWPNVWIRIIANFPVDNEEPILSLYNVLGRPKSVGTLTMDTDKYKAGIREDTQLLLLDYKTLTHPDDAEALLEGVKLIFKIIETEAFQRINFTYTAEPDPACSAFTFLSDDYWRCAIEQTASIWNHMVGTCSMGPDSGSSATSVVDTKFRVRGVYNLRVVDASVIPEITNSNQNAPIMMMAEKAAEEMLNFYKDTVSVSTTTTTTTTTERIETTPSLSSGTGTRLTLIGTKKLFLILTLIFTFYTNIS